MCVSFKFVVLALTIAASAAPQNDPGSSTTTATATTTTVAATTSTTATGSGNAGDLQSSTTLDPSVIATGFASDGNNPPVDNQSPSLTSTNNFINFCATRPDLEITNGKQIPAGSCNPAPMGLLPAQDKMPSSKFVFPKNNDVILSNAVFTVQMKVKNIQLGNFVNASGNFYSAPQFLNDQGFIFGHSHVTIDFVSSITDTEPTNPTVFAYFKGINTPADANNIVTVDVDKGLPPGTYRMASINAAANHQPVLAPIAQHGSLDDMVYFTVSDDPNTVTVRTGGGGGVGAAGGKTAGSAGGAAGAAAVLVLMTRLLVPLLL